MKYQCCHWITFLMKKASCFQQTCAGPSEKQRESHLVCELKLDGLAVSILYENGVLAVPRPVAMAPPGKISRLMCVYSRHSAEAARREYPGASGSAGEVFLPQAGFEKINEDARRRAGKFLLTHVMRQLVHCVSLSAYYSEATAHFFLLWRWCSGGGELPDTHLGRLLQFKKWGCRSAIG